MNVNASALFLYKGGFNANELKAGIRAAEAVLQAAGFTSDDAHRAAGAEADGRPYDAAACGAWYAAEKAAIEAASVGRAKAPKGACLLWLATSDSIPDRHPKAPPAFAGGRQAPPPPARFNA